MSNRVFGFQTGLGAGIFAGAILAVVNVTAVRAQSGGPASAPAQSTEPPPFDPDKPAARAARAKAPPPVPAPRSDAAPPKAPTRSAPSAAPGTAEAQPRRSVKAVDPWAEPETPPAPVSRPTAREHAIHNLTFAHDTLVFCGQLLQNTCNCWFVVRHHATPWGDMGSELYGIVNGCQAPCGPQP